MDVLAGRKTGGEIEGDIRVNVRGPDVKPLISYPEPDPFMFEKPSIAVKADTC
jgi:hypothetical protein